MTEPALPRSLASRVLATVFAILVMGGLLVMVSIWWNGRQATRQAYDRILVGAANDIAESIRIQGGAPLVDLPVSAFQLLAQAPDDRVFYVVTGPGGDVITGLNEDLHIPTPPREGTGPRFFDADLQGEPARFVQVVRPFVERDFSGPVEIVVGQTLRARTTMLNELMIDAAWPMALAGLVVMLIAWVVLRNALRPLKALTADLARRDPYDLTPMNTDDVPRELQVMLSAMNRFMGRLNGQVEAMRNLISDTAHQLRTPVAAIIVQSENAMQEARGGQGPGRALDKLLARSKSLSTLLDQLLSLALVVHRTDSAARVPVDLREVALEIMERDDHALIAPDCDLRLDIGEAPVMVRADAFSLGEAARNLLNNALSHGQSPVTIGASHAAGEARLWVRDSGPGPAPEITARLGDRFNRTSQSREQSAGIGLSIVHAVAVAFGGRVAMGREQDGFCAALVLPVAEDAE